MELKLGHSTPLEMPFRWYPFLPKSKFSFFGQNPWTIYKLDTETEGSTRFRNPRARGCSVPSALLRALGFLKRVDPSVSVSNL